MLEFPEVTVLSRQLKESITDKIIQSVLPPTKLHKFCWFNGDPNEYAKVIEGSKVIDAEGFGLYVEIAFSGGHKLCFNDGVNVRLVRAELMPKDYQLAILFTDGLALIFSVAMYGGIILHDGDYDNAYYRTSKKSVPILSKEFDEYFRKTFSGCDKNLSAKAFIATQQRFPGIGNGTAQDILFAARIHPKRKIGTFTETEEDDLLYCITAVLEDMACCGGRDTEKTLFGERGGYKTKLSKNTAGKDCPECGSRIVKESYLGGAIYFCPQCQKLCKDD